MDNDEGIRSRTQVQGQAPDGSLKNLRTDANGNLKVAMEGGGQTGTQDVNVVNTNAIGVEVANQSAIGVEVSNSNPIEVEVTNQISPVAEKVLASGVITAGTSSTSISINANVTTLEVANYSEDANVTLTIGQNSVVVGANIATELPINAAVTSIGVVASAADTKVYYLVKGVIEE